MTLLQRISREPNAVLGVIVAAYGLLVVFHVLVLTAQQVGGVTAFGGSMVVLLRWLVTPAAEVVVQKKPDDRTLVAGAASYLETGTPVEVDVTSLGKAA